MARFPSSVIVDTSVIIDLYRGGVLAELFRLPCRFRAPDVIIAELMIPSGEDLLAMGLGTLGLTGERVREVYELAADHQRLSVNDLFALVAAKELGVFLLTGDKALRNLATHMGIEVRGTLWVLDELVRRNMLSRSRAALALGDMIEAGSRLPSSECHKRLRAWNET